MARSSSLRRAFVLCCFLPASARAVDGSLDTSFDFDGKQTVAFDLGKAGEDNGSAIAGFGGGRIVLVGDVQTDVGGGDRDFAVVALDHDGALDDDFNLDGRIALFFDLGADKVDVGKAITAMPDGRTVVCGRASYAGPVTTEDRLVVSRIRDDGALDSQFGVNGRVVLTPFGHPDSSNGDCTSIVAHPDGRVVVPFVNEPYFQTGLIRLEEDGDLDPTFGGDGISELPSCGSVGIACQLSKVLLLPDGKYMGVGFKVVQVAPGEFVSRLFFARYTSSGLLDSSFNGDGQAVVTAPVDGAEHEGPRDAALDPAGRVVVLEHAGGGGVDDFFLVRIDSNGVEDDAFGIDGWSPIELTSTVGDDEEANGLLIQGDGKIVVTGYHQFDGPDYDCATMRLNPTATALDPTYGGAGRRTVAFDLGNTEDTDQCREVSAPDGRPLLVGRAMVGDTFDLAVARLTNAYVFADGFESGFRYFWSRATP